MTIRNVDRFVGELARQLIWRHTVKPKDAVHLATALRWKVPLFETFDQDLCNLDRKLGNPLLRIAIPHAAEVLELPGIIRREKPERKKPVRKTK